jgi:uncharacterized protein YndB with AHSA1/START domain
VIPSGHATSDEFALRGRRSRDSSCPFGADGPGRIRTCDLGIKSPLLYQLSYRPAVSDRVRSAAVVRAEHTVEIARPAHDVFALLTDVSRVPEWQRSAVESHADGPLAEGVRIHERRHFLGHDEETELEVTVFEPGRRLSLKTLKGPVRLSIDHVLEERDGRTKLHVKAEGKPHGLLRLAGPAVTAKARQELRRDFDRLKAILEE